MAMRTGVTELASETPRFTRVRALLYVVVALVIGAALVVAMTWFVVGSAPRSSAIAVAEHVTIAEHAALPDDDAYPAAVALGGDGMLYTGSYQSGALWSISRDGTINEIWGSRERIGSVTGLDVAPDGALLILDRITPLDAKGAIIWRYFEGQLDFVVQIPNDEFAGALLPDDVAIDSAGLIYVSDRAGKVLRFDGDGEYLGVWWTADCRVKCAPTGLAWDSADGSLLVTDSEQDAIYRIASKDGAPANTSRLFMDSDESGYGFDGIAVAASGEIYVALLGWNRVARLQDGDLVELAKDFRGASDIAYDADTDRLYVSNWNQFSLGFGTRPQLPFALDVIDLSP